MKKYIEQVNINDYTTFNGYQNNSSFKCNYNDKKVTGYQIYYDMDIFIIGFYVSSQNFNRWRNLTYFERFDYDKNDFNIGYRYGL